MKNASLLLFSIVIAAAVLTSCYKIPKVETHSGTASPPKQEAPSSHGIAAGRLEGTVKVEKQGSNVKVTYTFKNQTEHPIEVVGGAKYTLQKSNAVLEKGSVPIKDYIDLAQGEAYTDSKTFKNIKPGTYAIRVEWGDAVAAATFTLK